ncbi:hypothetical protein MSIMFI_03902 [Mycobacterium simulans]|uniref:hypothetical protein n=1 Tax=Mycobacterium simulans TaxID=627089 RepID=UPI0017490D9B|nr:hypothetical protein [Mycobacterium simulans]SON62377.1 hypothetical protein MSIMFI_03902 [Mycobacterium simulans]
MIDRLFRAFETVQEKYLRDPQFADAEARYRHVSWLRMERERTAGDIWDEADDLAPNGIHGAEAVNAAMDAHARAEDIVIEREIVGRLPRRLVHELRNGWAYRESEFTEPHDPARIDTGEMSTIHWYDRADAAHVAVAPVRDPVEYAGSHPIEDVALAPNVPWTNADKKAAMEKAIDIFGLEPGQWIELDWPPSGRLWDPGYVYTTEFERCEAHAEVDDDSACDDCAECQVSVRDVVERMAQWKWTTALRINEIAFDGEGKESDAEIYSDNAFEVGIIQQDPRKVVIGPPGEGLNW